LPLSRPAAVAALAVLVNSRRFGRLGHSIPQ
jgi:hypothetical protein